MAQNNVTEVVNGIVQPRLYQVYGDLIESKEVMEPISILAGSGPICGFDWVDTTKANLTIQSVWNATGGSDTFLKNLRNRARRVYIGTKENKAGHVYNAYTTPDGLVMIAPDTLTFNGVAPTGGWPNLINPEKAVMFVLKATHSYRASADENPPSVTDFNVQWVQIDENLSDILAWNYEDMFENLVGDLGINFNSDTDVLIGFYIVGWHPGWDSDPESARLKSICSSINYTLCLNPYGGKFPVNPYLTNPMDVPDLKARVANLEGSVPADVAKLNRYITNLMNSRGDGVEIEYTINSTTDEDEFIFTRLNIGGIELVPTGSTVSKRIQWQWREASIALGIYSKVSLTGKTSLTEDQWDIGAISYIVTQGDYWDGKMSFVSMPDRVTPLAAFEINDSYNAELILPNHAYSILNNHFVDGVTRLALGLSRYSDETGSYLRTFISHDIPSSEGQRLNIIAIYSNGVLSLDICHMTFSGATALEGINVKIGDLLITQDVRWKPILEKLSPLYVRPFYYGPYVFGEKGNTTKGYSSISLNTGIASSGYLYVILFGNYGSDSEGLQTNRRIFNWTIGDLNKAKKLIKCIKNPFRLNYDE